MQRDTEYDNSAIIIREVASIFRAIDTKLEYIEKRATKNTLDFRFDRQWKVNRYRRTKKAACTKEG